MSSNTIYPEPTVMASGDSTPYRLTAAQVWNGQYQTNLQVRVEDDMQDSNHIVENLSDNFTPFLTSMEQLPPSSLGIPSAWASGNRPALAAMERNVRRHANANYHSSYTPLSDLNVPQWLHKKLQAGRLPYLQLRMRDLEFAGFIARLGESMPTDEFAYMIAQSEDRHAQQGQTVGVILSQAPPVSIVGSKQKLKLKLAPKRKAPGDEDWDEKDHLPTKRKTVQASSADMTEASWNWLTTPDPPSLSNAYVTRAASTSPSEMAEPIGYTIPPLQLASQISPASGFANTSTLPVFPHRRALRLPPVALIPTTYSAPLAQQTAAQQLPTNFPLPPPLPNFLPRRILRFTRRVLLHGAPQPSPTPRPIPINERYDAWADRPKKRGAVEYAPPPGVLRILADLMTEGLLPEGTLTELRDPLKSRSTPANVDIRLCGALHVTAEEILDFFPNHLLHREIACRLFDAGWTADMIVKWIYRNRRLTDHTCAQRTTIQHQLGAGRDWKPTNHITKFAMAQVSTEGGYYRKGTQPQLIDYYLVDLANGVALNRFPTLNGRGALTHAIGHALENGHIWVKLSEVEAYVQDYHLDNDLLEVNVFEDEASWMKTQKINKIYYARNVSNRSF